jgi:hypothetical protein
MYSNSGVVGHLSCDNTSPVTCASELEVALSCNKFVGVTCRGWPNRRGWGLLLVLVVTPFRFCTVCGCCWSQRSGVNAQWGYHSRSFHPEQYLLCATSQKLEMTTASQVQLQASHLELLYNQTLGFDAARHSYPIDVYISENFRIWPLYTTKQ